MADDDDAQDARTGGAQSIRRALAVLRLVASGQERGVRLVDIAGHAGLKRSTAHRILRVLIEEGAVEQDTATRRYLIGREVSLLGLARSVRFPLRAIAEPHLRQLGETLGETAFLTIRNGADSVCIDRWLGSFPVKVLSIEIGARRPLGIGVSGLVLLAALPQDEAAAIVRRNAARLSAHGLTPAVLLRRAARVRVNGYAYAAVGVVPGSRAVAVPIVGRDGTVIAGLAVAATTPRLPESRVEEVVRSLRRTADAIGRQAMARLAR